MNKLMMLVAMLALVLAVTVPALAQPHVPLAVSAAPQEAETGNVELSGTIDQSGNNSDQCVTPQQFANTGPEQNAQGVFQYVSASGNIEPEGSTFTVAPESTVPCTQAVQQSSAASG